MAHKRPASPALPLDFFDQLMTKRNRSEETSEFGILKSLVTVKKPKDGDDAIILSPQLDRIQGSVKQSRYGMSRKQNRIWTEMLDEVDREWHEEFMYFKILYSALSPSTLLPWTILGSSELPRMDFVAGQTSEDSAPQFYNNAQVMFVVRRPSMRDNLNSKFKSMMITFDDMGTIDKLDLNLQGQVVGKPNLITCGDEPYISVFSAKADAIPVYKCSGSGAPLTVDIQNSNKIVNNTYSMGVVVPFRVIYTQRRCFLDIKLVALFNFE